MVPKQFSGNIIVQVGGNDCSDVTSEIVKYRFEALLFLIREHAPNSKIFISQIPQRRGNAYTSYKIREVNNFLHLLSLFEPNLFYISHPHLDSDNHLCKDGVHMTKMGYNEYVKNLADYLRDFHLAHIPSKIT